MSTLLLYFERRHQTTTLCRLMHSLAKPEQRWMVIKELTRNGRVFRPSDWAQRLATAVATPAMDRRVVFHPRVHTAVLGGLNCVVVDMRLEKEDPRLFNFLKDFATSNDLQVEISSRLESMRCP